MEIFEKALRIEHCSADPGQFAVEILNARNISAKIGLTHPTHASQPDDGPLRPGPLKQFQPEKPVNHMQVYLHIVSPNANGFTIGKDCPSKLHAILAKSESLASSNA
jgi:hypothetical protein